MGARLLLALLWMLHWLPLPVQAALGRALGRLLHALAGSRRRIADRNLALCFPEMPEGERAALVREHFQWLGRSILERGLLWFASPARLKRLIRLEGEVDLDAAKRGEQALDLLVRGGIPETGDGQPIGFRQFAVQRDKRRFPRTEDLAVERGAHEKGEGFPGAAAFLLFLDCNLRDDV